MVNVAKYGTCISPGSVFIELSVANHIVGPQHLPGNESLPGPQANQPSKKAMALEAS